MIHEREKYGVVEKSLVRQVSEEIRRSKSGEKNVLSTNSDLSKNFIVSTKTIKKYLGKLSTADRIYRTNVLQQRKNPERRKPERGLRRLREDLLERILKFGDNVKIPLKTAVEDSMKLAFKPYDLPVYMDNMFLFFLGMRQETCSTIRDCFDIVYRDAYEGTVAKRMIKKLFGEEPLDFKPHPKRKLKRRRLNFFSDQVSYVCAALTGDNSSPPYELLTSRDRTQNYLRGFLFRGARVDGKKVVSSLKTTIRPRILVNGMYKRDLLDGVKELVGSQDIEARSSKKGFAIYQLDSMRRVNELHLLSKPQEERLDGMLDAL